jgi:hypothetical protein
MNHNFYEKYKKKTLVSVKNWFPIGFLIPFIPLLVSFLTVFRVFFLLLLRFFAGLLKELQLNI